LNSISFPSGSEPTDPHTRSTSHHLQLVKLPGPRGSLPLSPHHAGPLVRPPPPQSSVPPCFRPQAHRVNLRSLCHDKAPSARFSAQSDFPVARALTGAPFLCRFATPQSPPSLTELLPPVGRSGCWHRAPEPRPHALCAAPGSCTMGRPHTDRPDRLGQAMVPFNWARGKPPRHVGQAVGLSLSPWRRY
jgi:hypothetical protein